MTDTVNRTKRRFRPILAAPGYCFLRFVILLVSLLLLPPVFVEEEPPRRIDPFDDELPPEAEFRLGTIRFPHPEAQEVIYSEDGSFLVSAGGPWVCVWDAKSATLRLKLQADPEFVFHVALSPDGKLLATSGKKIAKVWDLESGKLLAETERDKESICCLAFSPDGTTVATAGSGIALWEARTGKKLAHIPEYDGKAGGYVWFDRRGERLISVMTGRRWIAVWDARSGGLLRQTRFPGKRRSSINAAWSANTETLAIASQGMRLRLWDLSDGSQAIWLGPKVSALHAEPISLSRDGTTIAIGKPREVELWDVRSFRFLRTVAKCIRYPFSIALSPDGKTVAVGADNGLHILDLQSGIDLAEAQGHLASVTSIAFVPNGRLLSGSNDGTARVWNLGSQSEDFRLSWSGNEIYSVAVSPDGKTVAAAGLKAYSPLHSDELHYRTDVVLWDFSTTEELTTFWLPHNLQCRIAFSPDGNMLGCALRYYKMFFLRFAKGSKSITEIETTGSQQFTSISFCGSDNVVAAADTSGQLRLWDSLTGKEIAVVTRHSGAIESLACSPREKIVAYGDSKGEISLWDLGKGAELHRVQGPPNAVPALALSPDGRFLAAASLDSEAIYLWEASSGKLLRKLQAHKGGVGALDFSPDGAFLASGGDDCTVLIWNMKKIVCD